MKDICVMTLTSFSLYHFAQFGVFERKDRRRFISLGLALVAFLVLGSLRFYVPVLMIVSYGLWLWIHRTGFARLTVTGVLLLFTVLVLSKYGAIARDNQLTTSPFGIAAGLFRFMLTPRPWDIEERYQFLTIAVLFHWLFLLPVFQSARKFWQISYQHRFIVVYVVVACLFYSVVKELQGPRGRVQFIFLWAWLEFHFVYTIWIRWQGHQTFLHHELPPGKQITT